MRVYPLPIIQLCITVRISIDSQVTHMLCVCIRIHRLQLVSQLRRRIYQSSNERIRKHYNKNLKLQKRKLLLETISNNLKTSPDMLSKMMWSDLDENAIIDVFLTLEPAKLLLMYNVSLIQTLLFGCLKMKLVLDVTSSAKVFHQSICVFDLICRIISDVLIIFKI